MIHAPALRRFEYKITSASEDSAWESHLDELESDGWEVVAASPGLRRVSLKR
jgi:hypothetical protein